ncbi:MAG: ketoacyl-ACP synthase III [Arenicella sp.]
MTPFKTKIHSVGTHLPKQVIKSDDIFKEIKSEQQYNIPTDWMSKNMGIVERRVAPDSAQPSELAIPAAEKAIKNSNIDKKDIDAVIFCGIERDRPEPATAHTIADELNINASIAFDVANACFGFIDGMNIAAKFINSGTAKYALVVTGEVPTKILKTVVKNLKKGMDQASAKNLIGALSVGDAGGAVLMGRSDDSSGFELFRTFSQSQHTKKCYYQFDENGVFDGQMRMANLAALMIRNHSQLIQNTLDQLGWNEFDWMLSHQIGQRPFDKISELKGINPKRMIKTFDKLGNVASATFPINFHKLSKNGKVKPGERIGGCFAGSGIVIGQFGYSF